MASAGKRSRWPLKVYGSAVVISIAVGLLSGPTMPQQLALAARLLLACLMIPLAFVIVFHTYLCIVFRATTRRGFDRIAQMGDWTRLAIVDPKDAGNPNISALNARSRQAVACNAVLLGDVREYFTPGQSRPFACLRAMTLDEAQTLITFAHVRWPALHRLYFWLNGLSHHCNSIDIYSQLSNGRVVRTSDNSEFSWAGDEHVRQSYTKGQTLPQMMEIHRRELTDELAADPTAELSRFKRIEDAVAAGRHIIHLMSQATQRQGILSDERASACCRGLPHSRARIVLEELHAARKRFNCQPTTANTNIGTLGYDSSSARQP